METVAFVLIAPCVLQVGLASQQILVDKKYRWRKDCRDIDIPMAFHIVCLLNGFALCYQCIVLGVFGYNYERQHAGGAIHTYQLFFVGTAWVSVAYYAVIFFFVKELLVLGTLTQVHFQQSSATISKGMKVLYALYAGTCVLQTVESFNQSKEEWAMNYWWVLSTSIVSLALAAVCCFMYFSVMGGLPAGVGKATFKRGTRTTGILSIIGFAYFLYESIITLDGYYLGALEEEEDSTAARLGQVVICLIFDSLWLWAYWKKKDEDTRPTMLSIDVSGGPDVPSDQY